MQSLATSATTGTAVDLSKMIASFVNDTFVRESIVSRCKYQASNWMPWALRCGWPQN